MKRLSQIASVAHIKSAHSIGVRSIPKVQRSPYLELYVLRNEKDRLEREICALDRRKNALKRQLDSTSARIEKLQAEVDQQQPIKVCKSQPGGSFKKVAIDY